MYAKVPLLIRSCSVLNLHHHHHHHLTLTRSFLLRYAATLPSCSAPVFAKSPLLLLPREEAALGTFRNMIRHDGTRDTETRLPLNLDRAERHGKSAHLYPPLPTSLAKTIQTTAFEGPSLHYHVASC